MNNNNNHSNNNNNNNKEENITNTRRHETYELRNKKDNLYLLQEKKKMENCASFGAKIIIMLT